MASASAPISASANVLTIARSRSGLAWASCSSSQPETSILGPAAIAWLLLIEIFGRNSNENHAMAVSPHDATLNSGNIKHHIGGRNRALRLQLQLRWRDVSAAHAGVAWSRGLRHSICQAVCPAAAFTAGGVAARSAHQCGFAAVPQTR